MFNAINSVINLYGDGPAWKTVEQVLEEQREYAWNQCYEEEYLPLNEKARATLREVAKVIAMCNDWPIPNTDDDVSKTFKRHTEELKFKDLSKIVWERLFQSA